MAYPKWTQLSTPSGATAVDAMSTAGDLWKQSMQTIQGGLTAYDKGVETRLQEDSDVNTAALRRQLEGAGTLSELNAMQGDISATGLQGYGKRIDADALSQSFDKERGVLRGEFQQNFNEDFSQKLADSKTPEELALRRAELTQANTENSFLDISSQITNLNTASTAADEKALVQGQNKLTQGIQANNNLEELQALRKANVDTKADNWQALDNIYKQRIDQVTGENQTRFMNEIQKQGLELTAEELIAKRKLVDTKNLDSGAQIEAYTLAIAGADARAQKSFDTKVTSQLEEAKEQGIAALLAKAKTLKASPGSSRIDTSGIERMVNTLRQSAVGNSVSSITTQRIGQQQELMASNDKAIQSGVADVPGASDYVTYNDNGQIVFAKNTPQNIKDAVSIAADGYGYKVPTVGLAEDRGALTADLLERGFDPTQAAALTNSIDTALSISFNFNDKTKAKYDKGVGTLEGKQSDAIRNITDIFNADTKDIRSKLSEIEQNIVSAPGEDISTWLQSNVRSSGLIGISAQLDLGEAINVSNRVLEESVTITRNGKEETILVPPQILKIVLSRMMDDDQQVRTESLTESGSVEEIRARVQAELGKENSVLLSYAAALQEKNEAVNTVELNHAASVSALATELKVKSNLRQQNPLPDVDSAKNRVGTTAAAAAALAASQAAAQQRAQLAKSFAANQPPVNSAAVTGNNLLSGNQAVANASGSYQLGNSFGQGTKPVFTR